MYDNDTHAQTDLRRCANVEHEARQDYWFGSKVPQAVVRYPFGRADGKRYERMPKDQAYRLFWRGKLEGEIVFSIG
jgi:hypothetical protein